MGDKVKGLVSGYIEELEGKASKKSSKPVTFSMRLSERDHAKLVWLARGLDVPKTPLAEELLRAAVDEAIEQYAGWAGADDPESFLEQAATSIEEIERDPKAHKHPPGPGRGPRGPKPPGRRG